MSQSRISLTTRVLALTTVLGPTSIAAGNAAEDRPKTVEPSIEIVSNEAVDASMTQEIVVTAQKREQNVQDVPIAISALAGADLTDKGIGRSASEVLTYVPNASAGTQLHGRPRWWIRGVGAGQQQLDLANPVGFYLDEVYISNASATGFPLFDLDRVEVLRGPQGTLWGKNTTGGAISVVSKKPSLSEQDNYVKVDYGTFNDRIFEGAYGAVLIPGKLAGRISGHLENQDGWLRNLYTGETDGEFQDDAYRAQLLASITPDIEALFNVHYRNYRTSGAITTTASYLPNGLYRDGYRRVNDTTTVDTNAPDWSHTEQIGGSLNLNWDLGGYTLTAITGYERYKTLGVADTDYTPLEVSRSYTDAKSTQWTEEVRLVSLAEQRISWIAGLYYFHEDIKSDAFAARLPDGSVSQRPGSSAVRSFSDTIYSHQAESYAGFGSATAHVTDAFSVALGTRWTYEKKTLQFNRLGSASPAGTSWSDFNSWWASYTGTIGGPGTFAGDLSRSWNAFTYDVTPQYKIAPNHLVFFKYAVGVKSGGLNTAATLPVALQVVKPEKLDSYELGYKSEWLDGRLIFNATVFHYKYDDVQINVVGPNPGAVGAATVSYLQNAERAHSDGAELEINARPFDNFHINTSVGYLQTKFDKLQVVNGGANLSGNQFVRSPHWTFNVAVDYSIPVGNDSKITLGADARYTSHQFYYVTPQNDQTRRLLNQDPYLIANARISYALADDRYTFSVYVNNVFDQEYQNHALPAFTPGTVNGDIIYWAAPRTFGGSIIARF